MNSFSLKIVTPDGLFFDGQAQELIVRTTSGDLGIMAGHINCVAPLGMGQAMVLTEDTKRYGACIGGMVSVVNGAVTLVATTFEWAEDIDTARVEVSRLRAESILQDKTSSDTDIRLAEARLKRALIRSSVAKQNKR
ncbi:MAG: ATP synthase F1 subunit epsilon [Oscillospiraceae bacterium]|nr:ATP synthase F1 subunit epsilon [Oscillospiraceae bacterium]